MELVVRHSTWAIRNLLVQGAEIMYKNMLLLIVILMTILMMSALYSSKNCNIKIKGELKSFEFKFGTTEKNAFPIDNK